MKNRFWRVTFVRASFLACIFRGFVNFACFWTLKNRCFLWKLWGFCVFWFFPSSSSLRPHFGLILAPFLGPKSLKTALGRGSEKWWFFDYFFFTILAIFGFLGGSQGSPRGHHFCVIFVFFGVREANLLLRPPSWPNFANCWWFWGFWGVIFDDFCICFCEFCGVFLARV